MTRISVAQRLHRFEWSPLWQDRRLKEVLRDLLPELSSRAAVLIVANGLVRAGHAVLDNLDAPIPEGAALTVDLRHGVRGEKTPRHGRLADQIRVLYDDPHLVVLSKAAGVVVQPVPEDPGVGTPVVELLKHYWRARQEPAVNPILVQRLDKETSGLMVLAKSVPIARELQAQIARHVMERRYMALVEGQVAGERGIWRTMMGVGEDGRKQSLAKETEEKEGEETPSGAKLAVTHWAVQQRLATATLLELRLETGRTHQIRIHCAEAGHPVIGDPVYAHLARRRQRGSKPPKAPRITGRMMLHACKLKICHPGLGNRWLTFRDELPQEFRETLETRGRSPLSHGSPGRSGSGGPGR